MPRGTTSRIETVKQTRSTAGFTLVELLVVVAIIALLLGILLPALGKARSVALTVACLSNQRQMGAASLAFAAEHQNHVQISSSDLIWNRQVPRSDRYDFFPSSASGDPVLKDWASALVPYLGGESTQTFNDDEFQASGVYVCPSDRNQEGDDPGYKIFNNISDGPTDNKEVSYTVNGDLTSVNINAIARWTPNQSFNPAGGSNLAAEGNLTDVFVPSDTLMHMDMGTRVTPNGPPIDNSEILVISGSTWVIGDENLQGTLKAAAEATWSIRDKLPIESVSEAEARHGDDLNVLFVDGHAATTGSGEWRSVRISPNKF